MKGEIESRVVWIQGRTYLSGKDLCLIFLGLLTASPSAASTLPRGVPGTRPNPLPRPCPAGVGVPDKLLDECRLLSGVLISESGSSVWK